MVSQPRYSGFGSAPKAPVKPDHIAAAIRTVRAEINGLEALGEAFANDLRAPFDAAVEAIRAAAGTGRGDGHGQERTRRS